MYRHLRQTARQDFLQKRHHPHRISRPRNQPMESAPPTNSSTDATCSTSVDPPVYAAPCKQCLPYIDTDRPGHLLARRLWKPCPIDLDQSHQQWPLRHLARPHSQTRQRKTPEVHRYRQRTPQPPAQKYSIHSTSSHRNRCQRRLQSTVRLTEPKIPPRICRRHRCHRPNLNRSPPAVATSTSSYSMTTTATLS